MTPHQPRQTFGNEDGLLFYCALEVSSHTSKKNYKRIYKNKYGNMFIGAEKKTQEALDLLVLQFMEAMQGQLTKPIAGPLRACFRFHYPYTKKGHIPKKIMDLSNLYQGPEDALQKAGVIENDSQIESHDGSCRVYGSETKALEVGLFRHHQFKIDLGK